MLGCWTGIVVRSAKSIRIEPGSGKKAASAEVHRAVAERVTGQFLSTLDDAVLEDHGFTAQIDHFEFAIQEFIVETDDLVDADDPADLIEVAIHLWCFRDHDAAFGARGDHCVVGYGANDGAMGDDAFDGPTSTVFRGVPVSDQIGFEHDAAAGRDEVANWVPVCMTDPLGIEAKGVQGGTDGGVDLVKGSIGTSVPE